MTERVNNDRTGEPVKRDPNVAPDDMLVWLFGTLYDIANRILESLYYLIRGIVVWLGMLRESPVAVVGVLLIAFWLLTAIFAPLLTPFDPNAQDFTALADPTPGWWPWANHPLGTDHLGRDLWARLAFGARTVFIVAPLAVLSAYIVGCLMGMLAGYLGGWVDSLISRVSDIILSFPVLILYIILISTVGPSMLNIIVAVTLASSPGIGRIVRGMVLDLRNQEYVDAAKIRGERPIYIMVVELLPNARGPLIVDACVRMGYTIITIGVLGFLGLGLPPPDPDWGGMVKDTTAMIVVWPHMAILPCVAISSLVIGFNLLADGLREISLRD
ncbi:MAG: ABC transporter permease [Alphaproteobacteria bacterium]